MRQSTWKHLWLMIVVVLCVSLAAGPVLAGEDAGENGDALGEGEDDLAVLNRHLDQLVEEGSLDPVDSGAIGIIAGEMLSAHASSVSMEAVKAIIASFVEGDVSLSQAMKGVAMLLDAHQAGVAADDVDQLVTAMEEEDQHGMVVAEMAHALAAVASTTDGEDMSALARKLADMAAKKGDEGLERDEIPEIVSQARDRVREGSAKEGSGDEDQADKGDSDPAPSEEDKQGPPDDPGNGPPEGKGPGNGGQPQS